MIPTARPQLFQFLGECIGFNVQGGIGLVQEGPQLRVGGHLFEYFPEKGPDDRIGIRNKEEDRSLFFIYNSQRSVVPASPKDALVGEFRWRHRAAVRNIEHEPLYTWSNEWREQPYSAS